MARRVKIGSARQSGGSAPSQQKALSDVEVSGGNGPGGGSIVLDFMGGDDGERELTQEGAIEAYHTSPPLHMAVSAIARTVGEVTYGWEDDTEPGSFDLERPNRWHQSAEYFGLCAAYLKLGGALYGIKKQAAEGIESWLVPPHMMEEPEARSGKYQVEDGAVGGLTQTEFDRDELIVIHEPSLLDPYMHGRGSGQTVGYDVDIDAAASEHTAAYLENHARPDSLIGIEGMGEDDRKRFVNSMRQKHGGPRNSGKLEAFGTSGISVETLMADFSDLGTPELRKVSERICRQVFGVPPTMVGDVEDTNRATAETEEYLFKKNVVKPLVDKIVEAHNAQLVHMDLGEQYTITTGQIVPANTERRLDYAKEHPGAVYANESRQWLGLDPRDELEGQTLADTAPSPAPGPQQRQGHVHGKKKNDPRGPQARPGRPAHPARPRGDRRGGSG